MNCIILYWFG